MTYTPAPWEVSKHATPESSPQYGIHNGGRNDFAIIRGENAEADAKLITAAPDLLAALIELDQAAQADARFTYPKGTFEIVQAALSKAQA